VEEPRGHKKAPRDVISISGGEDKQLWSIGKLAARPALVKSGELSAFYASNAWPTWLGRVWLASKWTKGGSL